MNTPLVSIIIPTYNRAHLIGETLDSVLAQTYPNWECIIVDDGSTDNTKEVIDEYILRDSRFQYYQRPKDRLKGGSAARNYGFMVAKGEYVNWFDSDDVMSFDFLQEKVNAFSDKVQAVLHKNRYANYVLTRFRESKFTYSTSLNLFYHYGIEEIEIQTCCLMWKYNFLEGKLLFDENLDRYQDNEFHLRMLALKPEIVFIDKVLATIRGGNGDIGQISSNETLSKKKLYDIFYCRYQTLLLMNAVDEEYYKPFLKKAYKKLLWAFYDALLFEKKMFKRFQDLNVYYNKLKIVYLNKDVPFNDKIKSHLCLCYILFFGNTFYKKK